MTLVGLAVLVVYCAVVLYGSWRLALLMRPSEWLGEVLLTFTFGAAQTILVIQILSLFHALRPTELFVLSVLVNGSISWLTRHPQPEFRHRTPVYLSGILPQIWIWVKESPLLWIGVALSAFWALVGLLLMPNTDSYHFAMPLFWRQNESILPCAVCNPRTIGTVFAAEAICFPAVLFANAVAVFPFVTWVSVLLLAWVMFNLSQRCGASRNAALVAATTLFAYTTTAGSLMGGTPEVVLSALWFAASLYFVFQFAADVPRQRYPLGCSVICFLLACGAKNLVIFQAPVFGAALLLSGGRKLFTRRALGELTIAAVIGLVVSGVTWSYVSNAIWFGTPRGHEILQATLPKEWSASAVWTRIVRGIVSCFIDPLWVPGSMQERFKQFVLGAVELMGGKRVLNEDDSYYGFVNEVLRPGRGLGWMGMLVLAPSLIVTVIRLVRSRMSRSQVTEAQRTTLVLFIVAVGSLIATFALLRTQSIGVSRLILSSVVPGIPLAGLLLANVRFRRVVYLLVCGCYVAFSVLGSAALLRAYAGDASRLFEGTVFRPNRKRGGEIEYRQVGGATQRRHIRDLQLRYTIAPLMDALPERSTIGVVSHYNADEFSLFGRTHRNRLVILNDCRSPKTLRLPPPDGVDYIYIDAEDFLAPAVYEAAFPKFAVFFEVSGNGTPLYKVLKRRAD